MKKIIAAVVAIFVMLQAGLVAYARSQPTVYLRAPNVITSELAEVSVCIKDNAGLMGIKLTIEYPAAQINVRSIAVGDVLNVGNFTTDFGEKVGGFQVLWNHTNAVKTNGVLFTFRIQKVTDFECAKIKIAYSPEDTFDEKYHNVSLKCTDIKIYGTEKENGQSVSASEVGAETTLANHKNGIANEMLLKAVEQTLNQQHYASIKDVKQKEAFLDAFNEDFGKTMGDASYTITSFEELQNSYQSAFQGEYIKKIANGMGTSAAETIISEELKKAQASSIQSVRNQTSFVEAVQQRLASADTALPSLTEKVNTDTAIAILSVLYAPKDEAVTNQSSRQKKNVALKAPLAVILGLLIIGIGAVGYWQVRKRKSRDS